MDIDHLLKRGSAVQSGEGLHERKAAKRAQSKEVGEDIVQCAQELGLSDAADQYGISSTAAAKFLARAIKKQPELSAGQFIDSSKVRDIKSLILSCNTTSITKLVTVSAGRFTEAEIRIVKAQIEKDGVENWDC